MSFMIQLNSRPDIPMFPYWFPMALWAAVLTILDSKARRTMTIRREEQFLAISVITKCMKPPDKSSFPWRSYRLSLQMDQVLIRCLSPGIINRNWIYFLVRLELNTIFSVKLKSLSLPVKPYPTFSLCTSIGRLIRQVKHWF